MSSMSNDHFPDEEPDVDASDDLDVDEDAAPSDSDPDRVAGYSGDPDDAAEAAEAAAADWEATQLDNRPEPAAVSDAFLSRADVEPEGWDGLPAETVPVVEPMVDITVARPVPGSEHPLEAHPWKELDNERQLVLGPAEPAAVLPVTPYTETVGAPLGDDEESDGEVDPAALHADKVAKIAVQSDKERDGITPPWVGNAAGQHLKVDPAPVPEPHAKHDTPDRDDVPALQENVRHPVPPPVGDPESPVT